MKREKPLWVIQIERRSRNNSRKRKVEYKRWKKIHGPEWEETGRQLREAFSPERVARWDAILSQIPHDPEPKMIRRIIPGTIACDIKPF